MSDSTKRFGELLLSLGALDQKQIDIISNYQKENPDMRFGQIAVHLGFINQELLKKYL